MSHFVFFDELISYFNALCLLPLAGNLLSDKAFFNELYDMQGTKSGQVHRARSSFRAFPARTGNVSESISETGSAIPK